jgi:hypothetical protein
MSADVLPTFTSFDGCRRIASGDLKSNLLALKHAAESEAAGPLLTFSDLTGSVFDLDPRETDTEALGRWSASISPAQEKYPEAGVAEADPSSSLPRARGRPRLGVIAREVTLLPRHWSWLSAQPGGASVALRKLVEEARRTSAGRDVQRRNRERACRFMSALAGNLPGFEESTRALFAGDSKKFFESTRQWPADVRDYAGDLASFEESQSGPAEGAKGGAVVYPPQDED